MDEGLGDRVRQVFPESGDVLQVEEGRFNDGFDVGLKGEGGDQDDAQVADLQGWFTPFSPSTRHVDDDMMMIYAFIMRTHYKRLRMPAAQTHNKTCHYILKTDVTSHSFNFT